MVTGIDGKDDDKPITSAMLRMMIYLSLTIFYLFLFVYFLDISMFLFIDWFN